MVLAVAMGLFLWGRWRHDVIAAGALLACVLAGLVGPEVAFAGFGHPAVITVACVLVLSRALQRSGVVDVLARCLLPPRGGLLPSLATLTGLGALLSGFMNNVGAMALLMPVAVHIARRLDVAPGQVLMPLAFGTILGGMTTMIGTPPNLIVSSFRTQTAGMPFAMFDFAPVGLAVALTGVGFIALFGWRLVPARRQRGAEGFDTSAYFTELRVCEGGQAAGMRLRDIETVLEEVEAQTTALVRHGLRINAPHGARKVLAGDILVIEADIEALHAVMTRLGLEMAEAVAPVANAAGWHAPVGAGGVPGEDGRADDNGHHEGQNEGQDPTLGHMPPAEVVLAELVVRPGSAILNRSALGMALRTRYGLNLLAVSREGARSRARLRTLRFRAGDLLLLQGAPEAIAQFASDAGCVPLAERALHLPQRGQAMTACTIMALALAAAGFGLLPAAIAFALGVLATMVLRALPLRAIYESIDWPVIVLLASLIPVAGAMESTGAADLLARFMLVHLAQDQALMALALILVVTMFLSDLMNNAATAAVMCPIAIGVAASLGVNPDAFLMAVAVGASCAFLTPIGHQNNTLILGPGGFRFGDYWRLGLPLEGLVVVVSLPLLLRVWPL